MTKFKIFVKKKENHIEIKIRTQKSLDTEGKIKCSNPKPYNICIPLLEVRFSFVLKSQCLLAAFFKFIF